MPDPEAERARLLSAGRRMQAQTDQEALIMHNIAAFCLSVLAAAALLASVASAQDVGFDGFPFPIPYDGPAEGTAPALLARPSEPAGAGGYVQVKDGRFVLSQSGRPIRFWGTNLSIEGCLPPHDVADRMARRLAALGINCVRMHFLDAAGYPSGLWDAPGWGDIPHRGLHPEALDRLDYLVAKLKDQGIYTNLNLHVARTYGPADGFPPVGEGESIPELGKGIGAFYPRCIEEQKRYAGMLLTHVNSYTGRAYAEEPAVAMVEISNEDGLLMTWFGSAGGLDDLPRPYAQTLEHLWNDWLTARYASTDALRGAWAAGEVPGAGAELLKGEPDLQVAGQAQATVGETAGEGGDVIRTVNVLKGSTEPWHVQLLWHSLSVKAGTTYAFRLRLRANRQARVAVQCGMDHDPWNVLGLGQDATVTPDWQDYEFYFAPSAGDAPGADGRGGARMALTNLPQEGLRVEVAHVSLREAELQGLPAGQTLGGIAWVPRRTWDRRTEAFRLDELRFLHDTEVAYWKGICDYVQGELGAKMPVTGTALGCTTPRIAAETVDFVDGHSYWQHPEFPGRPWDQDNWIVRNRAMVDDPAGSTIAGLAAYRVFGLPYTVTEYNHPAPQLYAAEGFPLLAAYAAFQGWDGVFTYTYAHRDWERDTVDNFFDLKADPVKLAVQPACADIVAHGRIAPAPGVTIGRLSADDELRIMLKGRPWSFSPSAYDGGAPRLAWQESLLGVDAGRPAPAGGQAQAGTLRWETNGAGKGLVSFQQRTCAGLIGFARGRKLSVSRQTAGTAGEFMTITPGATSLGGFSVVLVNSVEGQALGEGGRYLITSVTRWANKGMGWNKEGTSVGQNWGRGPSLCEGVPLELTMARGGHAVRLFALNPDGSRREETGGREAQDGTVSFSVGPREKTLWYELVIGG
jgi:hypothetical protein